MRTTRPALTLLAALVLLGLEPAATLAQERADSADIPPEVRAEGRRLQEEARDHVEAQRWALAAQTYRQLYEFSREHSAPQAPIALWNVGLALMRIPGREAEARDAFQRFLDESTTLTEDPRVRDWRSTALEHIAELEARIGASGSAPNESESEDAGDATEAPPTSEAGSTHVAGPIVLGIGGAAIVAGLITGGVALGADSTFSETCPSRTNCPQEARASFDEARTLAATSDALWIGGTAVALAGVLITAFVRESGETPTVVSAVCNENGCVGTVAGRF